MNKLAYLRLPAAAALAAAITDASALAVAPPMPAFGAAASAGSAAALSPLLWAPVVALVLGMSAAMLWLLRKPQRPQARRTAFKAPVPRGRAPRRARPLRIPASARRPLPRRPLHWAPAPG